MDLLILLLCLLSMGVAGLLASEPVVFGDSTTPDHGATAGQSASAADLHDIQHGVRRGVEDDQVPDQTVWARRPIYWYATQGVDSTNMGNRAGQQLEHRALGGACKVFSLKTGQGRGAVSGEGQGPTSPA